MTDTERKEVELKPCPFCGNQPKEDISIKHVQPVYSCCVTEYMSKERWNTRPQDNNALVPLDRKEVYRSLNTVPVPYVDTQTGRISLTEYLERLSHQVCAKFGKDNSGMEEVFKRMEYILYAKKTLLGSKPDDKSRLEMIEHIIKDVRSKFSQQPPKQDNNEFGHSGDKTVSSYPEDKQHPPKERKVSLEEIVNLMVDYRYNVADGAIAILSLLNATEEREGEE